MVTIFALRRAGLALLSLLAASSLRAGHRGVDVSIDDGRDPRRCDQIAVTIDGREAERAEQRLTLAADPRRPLHVAVPEHSGARVRGTDREDYEVLVCKAAASRAALERIAVSEAGGELTIAGPQDDTWLGYLLISAPRRAALNLTATDGPVKLSGLSGRITVRSQNGPIQISDSSGEIDAEAENGPIAFRGEGGRLRLRTQNGPIGVALSGAAWRGEGLDARAVNGPVRLAIPADYRSGAVVESLGRSPFQCRGPACSTARRSWDEEDHRRFELGEGPAVVRLSTQNGPVSISSEEGTEVDEED